MATGALAFLGVVERFDGLDGLDVLHGQGHHGVLGRFFAVEFAGDPALCHDQDPVAHAQHLGEVAGDHQHRVPGGGEFVDELVDLDLGAHVDSAGGLVEDEHLAVGQQPLADDDLLLIAAGQGAYALVETSHADRQLLGDPGRRAALPGPVDEPGAGGGAQRDQAQVLLDGGVQDQALALAVLGDEPDPGGHGRAHVVPGQPLTEDFDGAGVVRIGAEDGPYDLGTARADESGEPHHLPGPHLEGDVVEDAVPGQALDLEQGRPGFGRPPRVLLLDGAAHHQPDQFVLFGGGRDLGDAAAVAQDGDAVAEGRYLLQVVGDEDDADAVRAQGADDPEELVDLFGGEHRGRLVHDQDAGVQGQRLGDLDHLQPGDAQVAYAVGGGDVDPDAGQQFGGPLVHGLAVDQPQSARLAPQEDVLGDAEVGDEVELLVDGGDPEPFGVLGAVDAHRGAVDEDAAAVGAVGAGEHLDQRALARTVLAQQDVHLAAAQIEVDAVERDHAGEGLADALHAQQLGGRAPCARRHALRRLYGARRAHGLLPSGSPHERRVTRRADRITESVVRPSTRSISARTAARPSSPVGWAMAVIGGSVWTNHGMSSNAASATSPGTRRPRARISSIAPSAMRLSAAKMTSGGSGRSRKRAVTRRPLSAWKSPWPMKSAGRARPNSCSADRKASTRSRPVVVAAGPATMASRRWPSACRWATRSRTASVPSVRTTGTSTPLIQRSTKTIGVPERAASSISGEPPSVGVTSRPSMRRSMRVRTWWS
ncbi:hypothetical protein SBI_07000 [Streptomyces bingchenggensis BCW-1]|uniref:Uncharacterized protein n=1 Tax=Streptomyces bingchenggensis (strain BCW-1) TaxID=749414 RepID=D7C1Q5_STRBB|nr:hypothetical protein SBI_07000 [Streptomyces bingchenggensis BCW-1]